MSTIHAVNALEDPPSIPNAASVDDAIDRACARIAPTWPLDRFIAVNPFWGMVDTPLQDVAAKLRAMTGAQLLMPRAWFREAYRKRVFNDEHLHEALQRSDSLRSVFSIRALLQQPDAEPATRARVVDVADARRDLGHEVSWRTFVCQSISQYCAAYFDDGQAQLGPDRTWGLYGCWRRHALADRAPATLMRMDGYADHARALPDSARALVTEALATLRIPEAEREAYFWSLLLDVNGWASWCAYRRWIARLSNQDDHAISDLLAIRLAWELMLYRALHDGGRQAWRSSMAAWPQADEAARTARSDDWHLQSALEIAFREPVTKGLASGTREVRPHVASMQAVFCIDVRSEVYRRALETVSPSVQTLGFAGFFGLPIDYQPLAAGAARPQLPGLLAPRFRVVDAAIGTKAEQERVQKSRLSMAWKGFREDPMSTFTFVEGMGLTYAGKLLANSLGFGRGPAREKRASKLRLFLPASGEALDISERCELASNVLRGMSLTRDFAPVVLLLGHGSSTRNNPHAAGLDCGACCGQTGEVNARVTAALLNDREVREGLATRGIAIPDSTWFVAGLHDTTTDEVTLFDLEQASPARHADIDQVRAQLEAATALARKERARALGLGHLSGDKLARSIRARSKDWSHVRPEWGLANNAAFIVAPREHCRHLNLHGRAFLHEYRYQQDDGFAILELIMTAPMVVTHWINFQYYASTVDNRNYGSGNKVLHNVVGGHLGVFEGNGGDLRIGLPMQSLHDGKDWVHTPLRLSVFIEAPRPAIDAVLRKHAQVRALVENGWLSLHQLDDADHAVYALRGGAWHLEARAQVSEDLGVCRTRV